MKGYSSRRSYFHHEVNIKARITALSAAIVNNSPGICEFIFYIEIKADRLQLKKGEAPCVSALVTCVSPGYLLG
jgi:hypothetical protein